MDRKDFESLLNNYPDCVSDGKKLKAFLKDLYPDVPKAIVNTLTIMADDGIISKMQKAGQTPLVSARLQKKLEDDYGLSQKIISECFLLIIYDNVKQTKSTINAGTYEKITSFIDTQPTFELRKEGPQKLDILQPKYNPKDFEIVKGVLKKYKGRSSVVVIPDGVTSIGYEAFYGCTSRLKSVTIPNSVTSIGGYAFYNCTGLTSVTIGNGVKSIGYVAFRYCTGLTSITIPNSVTSIGYDAFSNTSWYNNQPEGLVYAGKVAYKYKGTMPSNTSIVLREGTLGIAGYAFSWCAGLTSITIPDSVTSIGDCAFYGCKGLTSVTIPDSVTSIGNEAFYDCTGLTSITVAKGNTKYHSAGNCLIETESKTLIAGCKNSIIPTDGSVTSIGNGAFGGCNGLTSVTIPGRVTSIGGEAFFWCTGLTSVTIPDSVTSIGKHAFNNCRGLTSITIPNSVTSIGANAFYGCTGLTSITIPDSVTSIGGEAFDGCRHLTIYCEAESKPIGWGSDWNPEHRPVVWGVKK